MIAQYENLNTELKNKYKVNFISGKIIKNS